MRTKYGTPDAFMKTWHRQPVTPEPPQKPLTDIDKIAREVIRGNWGNGQDRVRRLTAAGHDAAAVQARVNQLLRG
jgi:hypothetical protein